MLKNIAIVSVQYVSQSLFLMNMLPSGVWCKRDKALLYVEFKCCIILVPLSSFVISLQLGTDSAFRCNGRLVNYKLSRFLTTSNPVWNHDYAGEPIGVNSIDPGVNNEG